MKGLGIFMDDKNTIRMIDGKLVVPNHPIIPVIPGDGIGPEVWSATQKIVDFGVNKAYQSQRSLQWEPIMAGEAAFLQTGSWLPEETLKSFEQYLVGIKGPLTTPVGGGIRSLNVALRKDLDLYACVRPVKWFKGILAPVTHPQNVDITIFRENTEDVYSGIEFEAGSPEAVQFLNIFTKTFPEESKKFRFTKDVAIGIKPISQEGTKRLVRAAIEYAIRENKRLVTLVHKGNIMKFTEGGFLNWGYEVAHEEFADQVYTARHQMETSKAKGEMAAREEKQSALTEGKIWVNDIITDAAFQQVLLYPQDFDIIAAPNLNGDYLSDALAAQVGGIGIAPGANINYLSGMAIFEATHGTAPMIAGKNIANPCSLILSAEMMLRYIGWNEASRLIIKAVEQTISAGYLTVDLAQFVENATQLSTSDFANEICSQMNQLD